MASTRLTITLDEELLTRAHELGVDVSAAARAGVTAVVRAAFARADRAAYEAVERVADLGIEGSVAREDA